MYAIKARRTQGHSDRYSLQEPQRDSHQDFGYRLNFVCIQTSGPSGTRPDPTTEGGRSTMAQRFWTICFAVCSPYQIQLPARHHVRVRLQHGHRDLHERRLSRLGSHQHPGTGRHWGPRPLWLCSQGLSHPEPLFHRGPQSSQRGSWVHDDPGVLDGFFSLNII